MSKIDNAPYSASKPIVTRRMLHWMLHVALVEIRAASSLQSASNMADVFHNLPMSLLRCSTSEECAGEFEKLLERAARLGLREYLLKLRDGAYVSEQNFMRSAD